MSDPRIEAIVDDVILAVSASLSEAFIPKRLPKGWEQKERSTDGASFYSVREKASVILSVALEADGQWWLHVSMARKAYIPTYGDLAWLKETFIGADRYALQISPPKSLHVNIHSHCLHLWSPLERWPLPEFSGIIAGTRTI